jgi:hypothetical protein
MNVKEVSDHESELAEGHESETARVDSHPAMVPYSDARWFLSNWPARVGTSIAILRLIGEDGEIL